MADQILTSGCVVCGADTGQPVCEKQGYRIMLCRCGGSYLAPHPAEGVVDVTDDPHPASFYQLPAAGKLRWLERHQEIGALLEVGCGDGYFLATAKMRGHRVRGIEADPARARRVAEQLSIPVEPALLEESTVPDAVVDVVYHCDLLSHFPDPVRSLRRMGRMLKPGGVLFFEVGMHGDIAPYWYTQMAADAVPRHRWFFDEAALRRLLANAGFRIQHIKRFGLAHQVLFYRTMGPPVRAWRGLFRGRRRSSVAAVEAADKAQSESPLQARINNYLRFGLGSVLRGFGPQTSFVIASPHRGGR